MISYLKGIVAAIQNNSGHRYTLTLEVNGIGYDLQIPARLAQQLVRGSVFMTDLMERRRREKCVVQKQQQSITFCW